MYQKYVLVGYLGADPDVRYTPNGVGVCSFRMAVTRSWVDAQGQKHEETEWPTIEVWGKLADTCAQYLKKGRLVLVEADRFKVETWAGKQDGSPKAKIVFTAQTVKFMGGGHRDEAAGEGATSAPPPRQSTPRPARSTAPTPSYEGDLAASEDEFPF